MLHNLSMQTRLCVMIASSAAVMCAQLRCNKTYSAASSSEHICSDRNHMKQLVGYASVDKYVQSNMKVGLGTGSTAFFAVERLGQKLKSGELRDIVCVPTSEKTAKQAKEWNIPLTTLDELAASSSNSSAHLLDVTIDGADEVELCTFTAIKGGGGALLREKMVEKASKQFVCIVDESKCIAQKCTKLRNKTSAVKGFGSKFPIPIEIVPFNYQTTMKQINEVPVLKLSLCTAVLRRNIDRTPFVTDNGNYIADLHCKTPLLNVERCCCLVFNKYICRDNADVLAELSEDLYNITGLVEHGLFIHMIDVLIIAHKDQTIEIVENPCKGKCDKRSSTSNTAVVAD